MVTFCLHCVELHSNAISNTNIPHLVSKQQIRNIKNNNDKVNDLQVLPLWKAGMSNTKVQIRTSVLMPTTKGRA